MTLEEVRREYADEIVDCCLTTQIYLNAWLAYAESRNKNGNDAMDFYNYCNHINDKMLLENLVLGVFDCENIGGKDNAIKHLKWRIGKTQ